MDNDGQFTSTSLRIHLDLPWNWPGRHQLGQILQDMWYETRVLSLDIYIYIHTCKKNALPFPHASYGFQPTRWVIWRLWKWIMQSPKKKKTFYMRKFSYIDSNKQCGHQNIYNLFTCTSKNHRNSRLKWSCRALWICKKSPCHASDPRFRVPFWLDNDCIIFPKRYRYKPFVVLYYTSSTKNQLQRWKKKQHLFLRNTAIIISS